MDGITLEDLNEYSKIRGVPWDIPLLSLPWAAWYFEVLGEMLEEETYDFKWLSFALGCKLSAPRLTYTRSTLRTVLIVNFRNSVEMLRKTALSRLIP